MSAFGAEPSTLQPSNAALPRHKYSRADLSSQASKRSQVVFTALGPTVLRPPRKPTVYYADRWDAYPTCVDTNTINETIRNESEVLGEADNDRGHEVTFESIPAATATGGEGGGDDEVIGGAATSRSVDQEQVPCSTVEETIERDTSVVDLDGNTTDTVENIRDGEQDKAVDGLTALMEACWHGRVDVARKLLQEHHAKSCVDAKLIHKYRNRQQQSQQRHAKRSHLMRISADSHNPVEALLESDWFGSPLHYACIAGRTSCAHLLLFGELGECVESNGRLRKEVRWEVPEVTSDVSQPSTNVLECSVCMGSRHFLRVVDPWACNSYGSTPLHKAAASGSLPTVQLLLSLLAHPQDSCCASVRMSNSKGSEIGKCNCSHTSYCGRSNFSDNPLEAVNWRGDRPLHAAARIGSLACCAVLLAAGCDGSARNSAGQTALDVAEGKNHFEAAAVLRTAALQRVSCDDEETNDANDVNDSFKSERSWNECVRDGGVGNGNGHAAVEMVKSRHADNINAALAAAAEAPVSLAESWVPSVGAHLVPLDASLASQREFFPSRIIDVPKPQWYSDEPPQPPQPPFESYTAPSAARADQPAMQAARDRQNSEQEEKTTSRAAYKAPTEGYDFLLSPAQRWGSPIS